MARSNLDPLRTALKTLGVQGVELDWEIVTLCIKLKGLTLQRIAVASGLSVATMPQTKYRHMPRYEVAIADALGLTPQDLWPDRYQGSTIKLSSEDAAHA